MISEFAVREIRPGDKDVVRRLLTERWESHLVTSKGKLLDGTTLDGYIAENEKGVIGLVTLEVTKNQCEVVTIDSFLPKCGVGSSLLKAAENYARAKKCVRLWVVTSNDNLDALRFYQKYGMRLAALYPGAIDRARATVKPQIPTHAENGIPIRDEIELEIMLGETG